MCELDSGILRRSNDRLTCPNRIWIRCTIGLVVDVMKLAHVGRSTGYHFEVDVLGNNVDILGA